MTIVAYYDDHGKRIRTNAWWRYAMVWSHPVCGNLADSDRPTPADVYHDIAALPETLYDEPGITQPQPRRTARDLAKDEWDWVEDE